MTETGDRSHDRRTKAWTRFQAEKGLKLVRVLGDLICLTGEISHP